MKKTLFYVLAILLLAGSLLACSILTDVFQFHIPFRYDFVQIIEEAFKFAGGATWLHFCCSVASHVPVSTEA